LKKLKIKVSKIRPQNTLHAVVNKNWSITLKAVATSGSQGL